MANTYAETQKVVGTQLIDKNNIMEKRLTKKYHSKIRTKAALLNLKNILNPGSLKLKEIQHALTISCMLFFLMNNRG